MTQSSIDAQTGTVQIRAIFPNPDGVILPGQFVRVLLRGVTLPDAILIPKLAVLQGPRGPFVYVVASNGTAEARPVRLGRELDNNAVVEDGLQGSEQLIVDGVMRVRRGARKGGCDVGQGPCRQGCCQMISRFFIDRPVFASVLSIVIVLAGLVAMRVLPIAQYPQIVPPEVVISATYPGANAQTIAETVAAPLEQQINGVERMIYMRSTSTDSGAHAAHHHFRDRYQPRPGHHQRQQSGAARRAVPSGRGQPAGRNSTETVQHDPPTADDVLAQRPL